MQTSPQSTSVIWYNRSGSPW